MQPIVLYGAGHYDEGSLFGCLLDHFRAGSLVCTKLFCGKGMPTGAASPLCVRSHQASRAQTAIFAGTERHDQLAAAFKALSLSHGHLVPEKVGSIRRVKTGKSRPKCLPKVRVRKGPSGHLASEQGFPISRPSASATLPVQLFV